ncbi:MAG: hypothetical protein Unbinned767contig1000_1 [Prokaryotic dsDNA virus sp.]|nr:MAG: hypothetical protein Unbinned767contig1000_1 [Prokaryotic dsDNA virus sp.]
MLITNQCAGTARAERRIEMMSRHNHKPRRSSDPKAQAKRVLEAHAAILEDFAKGLIDERERDLRTLRLSWRIPRR